MTSRTDSASSRSPRAVEPARSVKTTVTRFRTSRGGGASAAPQAGQKLTPVGASSPQRGQGGMERVYDCPGRPLLRARRGRAVVGGEADHMERSDICEPPKTVMSTRIDRKSECRLRTYVWHR